MTTVNGTTGFSPQQAVDQVIANLGPITDAASALAVANGADSINSVFDDTNSDANLRYSGTFYNGASTGTVTARLDNGYQIDYGVRADDPAFRELQQGLYMLASVPYGSIPDDAYAAWQDEAVRHINNGFQGAIDVSAELGYKQSVVNTAITQHGPRSSSSTIRSLTRGRRSVPGFVAPGPVADAAGATFSITARMSRAEPHEVPLGPRADRQRLLPRSRVKVGIGGGSLGSGPVPPAPRTGRSRPAERTGRRPPQQSSPPCRHPLP
jgi:flagellar hook-associated protein 3 FlgL